MNGWMIVFTVWTSRILFSAARSNILVERDPNYWIRPLITGVFRMPWCHLMTDLVTVLDTNAPEVRVRISLAQITRLVVFKDLLERPEWRRAAFCHWYDLCAFDTHVEPDSPFARSMHSRTRNLRTR